MTRGTSFCECGSQAARPHHPRRRETCHGNDSTDWSLPAWRSSSRYPQWHPQARENRTHNTGTCIMGTDRTGAGITGTDTMDAALAGVAITGSDVIGAGLIDADITGKALAGMSTPCAVTGRAAITDPGITTCPTCTLPMFTYPVSTCTSCFHCTGGRAKTSLRCDVAHLQHVGRISEA